MPRFTLVPPNRLLAGFLNGINLPRVMRFKTLVCKITGVVFSVAGNLDLGLISTIVVVGGGTCVRTCVCSGGGGGGGGASVLCVCGV